MMGKAESHPCNENYVGRKQAVLVGLCFCREQRSWVQAVPLRTGHALAHTVEKDRAVCHIIFYNCSMSCLQSLRGEWGGFHVKFFLFMQVGK